MTQQEYEQKKRECWEEYCQQYGHTYGRIAFDFAFDRAYALGKQEGPSKNSSEIKRELSKNSSESNPAEPTENKADEIADKAINPIEEYLFGRHNLTSDEEGEEMLICEKSKVQRAYNTSREIVKAENPDSLMYSMHTQIMCVLESIFGTKCLPDANEDNFVSIEPKPAEPKNEVVKMKS